MTVKSNSEVIDQANQAEGLSAEARAALHGKSYLCALLERSEANELSKED